VPTFVIVLSDHGFHSFRQAVNLDWKDLPLRSLLKKRYGLPLTVCQLAVSACLCGSVFLSDAAVEIRCRNERDKMRPGVISLR
jgi:hypothetical protein